MTDETTDFSDSGIEADDLDDFSATLFAAEKPLEEATPEEPSSQDPDPELDLGDEEGEQEEADADPDPEPEPQTGKKKSRFQERIDDLTAKLREGDRLREAQAADLAKALAKLEELAAPKADEAPQNTKTRGLVEPTADDLNEDGSPKYPLGEFDPKLLRDLTRYDRAVERQHDEEVLAAQREEQKQIEEFNTLQASWNDKVATAKEVYPDYVQKGEALLSELSDVPQEMAVYLTQNLMDMEYGPDVFYYLAEHPEEARVIANSSPERALNRLGRIEARFEIAALEQSGKETKLRTTKAPEPAPRNRGSNAAAPSIDLETASLDDFERELYPTRRR